MVPRFWSNRFLRTLYLAIKCGRHRPEILLGLFSFSGTHELEPDDPWSMDHGKAEFRDFRTQGMKLESENSSDCRASKIIFNDTQLEPISWELNVGNQLLNFCVFV